jgi:hypothetical protein
MHKKSSQVVTTYHATLSPVPLPKLGDAVGSGCPSCAHQGGGPVTGGTVNWNSAFINDTGLPDNAWLTIDNQPPEQFNGTAHDLLTVQTFAAGSTEDLGACHAYGFKKYAAAKQWHGWYPWTWPTDGCTPYASTPSQVKYLTVTYSVSIEWKIGAGISESYNYLGTIAGARTINHTTGEITDSLAFTNGNQVYADIPTPHYSPPAEPPFYIPGQSVDLATAFSSLITTPPHCNGVELNLHGIFNGSLENLVDTWNSGDPWNFDPSAGVFIPPTPQITYTKNLCTSQSVTAAPSSATITVSWSRTDTVYTFSVNIVKNSYNLINCSGTITLSDPYYATIAAGTPSNEDDGENNLLIKWPLNGPEPWRHDQFTSIMPLVCRREVQTNVTPIDSFTITPSTSASFSNTVNDLTLPINDSNGNTPFSGGWTPTYTQRAWFDPKCYVWYWTTGDSSSHAAAGLRLVMDGNIIGAPHPNGAGANGWFDFYYTDIRYCATDQTGTPPCSPLFLGYNFAYGANLAEARISLSDNVLCDLSLYYDNILPQNATHWTNNHWAHNIPRGAMIDLGQVQMSISGVPNPSTAPIFFIKAAFARLPVPSYNFFGSCGAYGRTLIDEPSAKYLNLTGEVAGVSVAMSSPLPSSPTLSGQRILIYGSTGSDGIWTGCTQATVAGITTLTLTTKVAQLPTGYTHPFVTSPAVTPYYTGICGILRFPAAWPICSRQAITFASDGITGTIISFASSQTGLWSGDILDTNNSSMTVVQSNQTIKRFDLFQHSHTYTAGDCVFDGTNGQLCTTGGTTVLTPAWSTSLLGTTTAGTAVFTLIKLAPNVDRDFHTTTASSSFTASVWATNPATPVSGSAAPAWYWYDAAQKFDLRYGSWNNQNRYANWAASTAYAAGSVVKDSNGNYQTAGGAGTSGGSAPSWPTTAGGTVNDNGITWTTSLFFNGAQAGCLPMSPCYPQVIAFTPNGESWPNMTVPDGMGGTASVATGQNHWFGAGGLQSFTADGVSGSRVQANVEFDLPDLLYQTPACPPATGGNVFNCTEDDGTLDGMGNCKVDQDAISPFTLYFAPRPRMEAIAAPPGGAPPLPTDCFGTALTWPTMVQPPNPGLTSNDYHLPSYAGTSFPAYEYWVLYTNELESIPKNCRFNPYYYALTLGGGK